MSDTLRIVRTVLGEELPFDRDTCIDFIVDFPDCPEKLSHLPNSEVSGLYAGIIDKEIVVFGNYQHALEDCDQRTPIWGLGGDRIR